MYQKRSPSSKAKFLKSVLTITLAKSKEPTLRTARNLKLPILHSLHIEVKQAPMEEKEKSHLGLLLKDSHLEHFPEGNLINVKIMKV